MVKIIDTYSKINYLFENGVFNRKRWETYINSIYDKTSEILINDVEESLQNSNYTYEKDILPILNSVCNHPALETLHRSFCKVTDGINQKIVNCFGNELNIDIVLYVGLCNGAGCMANINRRDVILLGIEKILELNWHDEDSMYGLVYHELGHAYHNQYGMLNQNSEDNSQNFVWQLFSEGIAMYFEQALVGDFNYYHQNKNGWLSYCDNHFEEILLDFSLDLPKMTRSNQRYFGDWVRYEGYGDVGYYLGARFIQHLRGKYTFKDLINMKIGNVYAEYVDFAAEIQKSFSG